MVAGNSLGGFTALYAASSAAATEGKGKKHKKQGRYWDINIISIIFYMIRREEVMNNK